MNRIVEMIRNSFMNSWDRETWEAFVQEPWFGNNLPEKEYAAFLNQARQYACSVMWSDYLSTWNCVLASYRKLSEAFRLPEGLRNASSRKMMRRFMIGRVNTFQQVEREEQYRGTCIEPGKEDLHNVDMAYIFAMLPPQPETAEWLKDIGVTYEYDNLHMVTWFSGQLSLGEGFYSRSCPNHSAKKTYERLKNPWSLLWIAAALGEDPAVVKAAAQEMEDYLSWTAKCGVIRRAVPWNRIYGLALRMKKLEESGKLNWDIPMTEISAAGHDEAVNW